MNKTAFFVVPLMMLCSSLFVTGCSGTKEAAIVWPAPPDEPRVAFVRSLQGEDDFSSGVGAALSSIAGERSIIRLKKPFDVCVAGKDIVYVTDLSQGIMKFDIGRGKIELIGAQSTEDLKDPRGIAYGHNQLFVSLLGSGRITVLDDDGRVIRNIGNPGQFPSVVDIVHDSARNRIIFVENTMHQVFVYSETGDSLFVIGRRGQDTATFNYPQSVTVDRDGNILVVDGFNFRVQVFSPDGRFLRMFGRQGDVWGAFARPKGISIDSYGNIYVLDAVHQNFQVFNTDGELLMFVGKYSRQNDGFANPVSIAIDAENTIYVTDQLNSRLQVFRLLKGN